MKILLFRILGNDLPGIHGNTQTINNLKFTLENESKFPYTDKIYLLNRIYDRNKRKKIINLLKKYNTRFLEIPFNLNEYFNIKYDNNIDNLIKTNLKNKEFLRLIKKHNLYLINNNGSRNFCINYGKKNNYDWIFPLDSNSFFTNKYFNQLLKIIQTQKNLDYLIIPQIRIKDLNIQNNEILFNQNKLEKLKINEPQIAFHKNSKLLFNENIPYGFSPKAEFLRMIDVPGKWKNWNDNLKYYNIKDRKKQIVNYIIISKVIRLNPQEKYNGFNNFNRRIIGLYNLIKLIRNQNKKIEYFNNLNKSKLYKKNYLFYLLLVLTILIILIKKKQIILFLYN